jgi:hypothetical protein
MNEPLEIRCQTSYRMTIATDAELRCVIADLKTQVQERDAVLQQALDELERAEAIMLRECGIGVVNRVVIAAINEVLK